MIKPVKTIQILNIAGFMAVIVVNILANTLPINDQTTQSVSASYKNLFTPAGFTFGIWSVIYLGLLSFVIYQSKGVLQRGANTAKTVASQLGVIFFLNCMANVAWLISWHYEIFPLTIAFMAFILLTLIDINVRIYSLIEKMGTSLPLKWLVKIPFGLYLGWICIAAIANVAVYLTDLDWQGFGLSEQVWAAIMIIIGGGVGLFLLKRLRLISAVIAITWGIAGIYFNRWQDSTPTVSTTCIIVIIALIVGLILMELKRKPITQHTNI